ncbi:hypothetical protein FKM82_017899 [Ascaphus truei]
MFLDFLADSLSAAYKEGRISAVLFQGLGVKLLPRYLINPQLVPLGFFFFSNYANLIDGDRFNNGCFFFRSNGRGGGRD